MSHQAIKSGYKSLSDRLELFPQWAPPSEFLEPILKLLFSEKEAALVSRLPIKPFNAAMAAKIWNKSLSDSTAILEELASRGMLLDMEDKGERVFVLPPPMAGFFEFSLMRVDGRMDQKRLAELYYQYLNVEEDFVRELFAGGETQLGRVFINEKSVTSANMLNVLDYERASHIIKTASHRGVGVCYCRHKMEHLGKDCDAPKDICLTFNGTAQSLNKYGVSREISVSEGMALLERAMEHNLVQFGENVREQVSFICNCCGCCCEAMLAAKRFAVLNPISTTSFIPQVREADCTACGKCAEVCPVEAMGLVSAGHPKNPRQKKARINPDLCLGCGVCARVCAKNALSMERRPERILTPVNTAHRAVLMAIERGKLQNLIFDNQAFASHRAMAAILGVILKLPVVKQVMASAQMKSIYLDRLLSVKEFQQKV